MRGMIEQYRQVVDVVNARHPKTGGTVGHHDIHHALRVAGLAYQCAKEEWDVRTAELAWFAGLGHNADRILQYELKLGRKDVPHEAVTALLKEWFASVMTEAELLLVTQAILRHDRHNNGEDSPVQIALMDADRIVNMDVDVWCRSGAYYHELPAVNYARFPDWDPTATYRAPGSSLQNLKFGTEWGDPTKSVCVRTKLGRKKMAARIANFNSQEQLLKEQLTEEGLYPYPL